MTEDDLPDANELEQIAQSLAMDGSLTRHDAITVAAVLRWVAARRRFERLPAANSARPTVTFVRRGA